MAEDKVSLTPSKRGNTTVLRIDRVGAVDNTRIYHEGQGVNRGLVINEQRSYQADDPEPAHLQLEFKCWLLNSATGDRVPESRQLKFWFKEEASYLDRVSLSYEFFRELVQPENFPRDYLNFVKRSMKQLQSSYFVLLRRIDVELTPLDSEQDQIIPVQDMKSLSMPLDSAEGSAAVHNWFKIEAVRYLESLSLCQEKKSSEAADGEHESTDDLITVSITQPFTYSEALELAGIQETDSRSHREKLLDQVLFLLESAYPNILEIDDLAKRVNSPILYTSTLDRRGILAQITGATEAEIMEVLEELASRGLIKRMEDQKGWTRRVEMGETSAPGQIGQEEHTIVIQQMPTLTTKERPTIAIITSSYYEKLAVDAMMENKTTYVKYQSSTEAHVYTLGYIGEHRVVSTKLPQIGRTRGAQISSGNNTTRLLGTFGQIEHVFMVGGAGGVPHYTDYFKHVRLGDVVVSTPNDKGHIYVFCNKLVEDRKTHEISYQLKTYFPKDPCIQERVEEIRSYCDSNPAAQPWCDYMQEGQDLLRGQAASFQRPPPDTDKLFMHLGEHDVIEVAHPQPPTGQHDTTRLVVHHGPVGSGRSVIKGATARQEFAYKHGIMAFDREFDQVLDSIIGNVKYSFAIIRGIVDYADGSSNAAKKWLPYSALAAAAYMKTVIKSMPNI